MYKFQEKFNWSIVKFFWKVLNYLTESSKISLLSVIHRTDHHFTDIVFRWQPIADVEWESSRLVTIICQCNTGNVTCLIFMKWYIICTTIPSNDLIILFIVSWLFLQFLEAIVLLDFFELPLLEVLHWLLLILLIVMIQIFIDWNLSVLWSSIRTLLLLVECCYIKGYLSEVYPKSAI